MVVSQKPPPGAIDVLVRISIFKSYAIESARVNGQPVKPATESTVRLARAREPARVDVEFGLR